MFALDPHRAMSQYVHEQWDTERDFPHGSVYAIAQTQDGYLWIAVEAGLLRYDGVSFRLMRDQSGVLPATAVIGLVSDRGDSLWVRLRNTYLIRYRNRKFEDPFRRPTLNVTAMTTAYDGRFLAAWEQRGAFTFDKGSLSAVAAATGLPRSPVLAMAQTPDGSAWMGTRGAGLYRLQSNQTVRFPGLPDPKVNCLLTDHQGNLWIGMDRGLALWNGSKIVVPPAAAPLAGFQILALTEDHDGNLWIGTDSHGLVRLNSSGVSFLAPAKSQTAAVTAIFEDRENNIWFGSVNRIERLRDSAFITYSLPEGLPTDGSNPVFVDSEERLWFPPVTGGLWWARDGSHGAIHAAGLDKDVIYSIAGREGELWVGRQRGGLTRLKTAARSADVDSVTYTAANGLAQDSVYSVYLARDGTVWAGTLSGGVSRLRGGRFTRFTTADGLASNTVASILEDTHGAVWLATPEGLSAFEKGRWKTYTSADGLPSDNINCLFEDSTGVLWAGSTAGLAFRESGRFHVPAAVPAELREPILGMAQDAAGFLWIATSNHVLRVSRDQLARGSLVEGDLRSFGVADGLRGVEGVKRDQSVFRDRSGRIWFSLNRGISVVDPARLAGSSAPAIPHIQTVSVGDRSFDAVDSFHVPAGDRRIEFAYTGLSFAHPESVRFRYMVDNFDKGWSEPVADRKATYTNLAPGSYSFRVIASNPQGGWSKDAATINFQVDPLFWQTWWFYTAVAAALLIAGAGLYNSRLRLLTARLNLRFEERLAERTRIAQELHDTLLQGFLSASMQLHVVADQIPEESPVKLALAKVMGLMGRVIDEGRNAVRGLRSSSASLDLGLAFSKIPQELPPHEGTTYRVVVNGEHRALHPILRDEVYRIGREAVVNAFRHSSASAIEVEVDYSSRELRVVVRDNGCGIDPSLLQSGRGREGHWGLAGMRERAERIGGKVRLSSGAMAGTEVEISIPGNIAFRKDYSDPNMTSMGKMGKNG
jgi:ligand-binding sensor domain-containing protein/signal transduction histidine kinase